MASRRPNAGYWPGQYSRYLILHNLFVGRYEYMRTLGMCCRNWGKAPLVGGTRQSVLVQTDPAARQLDGSRSRLGGGCASASGICVD